MIVVNGEAPPLLGLSQTDVALTVLSVPETSVLLHRDAEIPHHGLSSDSGQAARITPGAAVIEADHREHLTAQATPSTTFFDQPLSFSLVGSLAWTAVGIPPPGRELVDRQFLLAN